MRLINCLHKLGIPGAHRAKDRLSAEMFLIRGVQRGYFSFQRGCSEIMKADELLISARGLRGRSRFLLADSRVNERLGDLAPTQNSSYGTLTL
jgi:hypothetical protein